MPSRINSTTTSPGGLISTGDSDNSLLIQTGDTTAITVNSAQVVSLTNPLPVASGGTGASSNAAAPFALKGANTDITSLGGLTTALSIAQGGTGQTTAAAAFNALNPMTTTGDILYEASPTVAARLGIGSNGQVLTVASGIPSWAALPAGGVTSLNGQTGAVVTTDYGVIGATALLANASTSSYIPNTTLAGSSLFRPTTYTGNFTGNIGLASIVSEGTNNSVPRTVWFSNSTNKVNGGNTGFVNPGGSTAVSGTWRALGYGNPRTSEFNPCNNETFSGCAVAMWVRIS